jgi:hypothetical protein
MPCPESSSGQHEIDEVVYEDLLPDGSGISVIVTCAHCGRDGIGLVRMKKVEWDEDDEDAAAEETWE